MYTIFRGSRVKESVSSSSWCVEMQIYINTDQDSLQCYRLPFVHLRIGSYAFSSYMIMQDCNIGLSFHEVFSDAKVHEKNPVLYTFDAVSLFSFSFSLFEIT